MSDWPALMTRETAAAYCDMTAEQFDAHCPVAPVDQGWRGLRWKRAELDAWIKNRRERNLDASDFETIEAALLLALRLAENEYETRGAEIDARYEIKAGDVIADIRHALDVLRHG